MATVFYPVIMTLRWTWALSIFLLSGGLAFSHTKQSEHSTKVRKATLDADSNLKWITKDGVQLPSGHFGFRLQGGPEKKGNRVSQNGLYRIDVSALISNDSNLSQEGIEISFSYDIDDLKAVSNMQELVFARKKTLDWVNTLEPTTHSFRFHFRNTPPNAEDLEYTIHQVRDFLERDVKPRFDISDQTIEELIEKVSHPPQLNKQSR